MASRVSFQGLTMSSAQRGAAEATDSDAATLLARRVGRRSCGAKAAVRCDELGGASMQPSTAVLQEATLVCWLVFQWHTCVSKRRLSS
jgi:hypothetical protein